MRTEKIHTLILGAGPSGLAAGYSLAKAGPKPVVLEKDKTPGGLMRCIHRGDFVVDVGRKELYNRLAKVDEFWNKLLGSDYRTYPHRGGILYDGHIIDMSPSFQGFRRGMPWGMFLTCASEFVWRRLGPGRRTPHTVEEYFYQTRGRGLTRIFAQGFQEKLTGKRWADVRLAENQDNGTQAGSATLKEALVRAFSKKEVNTFKGIWRHPAKGTGQICDSIAQGILEAGGTIHYQARLTAIAPAAGKIGSVTAELGNETVTFEPEHVVSSVPLEMLRSYLFSNSAVARPNKPLTSVLPQRTVILVYLFLDEEPRFPQAWLQVTCPKTRIGRITNYTAFNGDMVPKGKTCLCCEYYCFGPDALVDMDPAGIAKMTLDDCARFKLVDPSKCFDQMVLKLPGADASQNRDNWMMQSRLKLIEELAQFRNLYCVNRTETDIATLAGMEAAEAILSGERADFDRRIDPSELGIRSESKAFEFSLPAGIQA